MPYIWCCPVLPIAVPFPFLFKNCFLFLILFPFSKIMGNRTSHAYRLHNSTRHWQLSSALKAWWSVADTFTPSLARSHVFAQGLESEGSAVSHLQETFKTQLIILNWVMAVRSAFLFPQLEGGWEAVTHGEVKRVQSMTFLSIANDSVEESCSFLYAF